MTAVPSAALSHPGCAVNRGFPAAWFSSGKNLWQFRQPFPAQMGHFSSFLMSPISPSSSYTRCVLTFDFVPRLVVVSSSNGYGGSDIFVHDSPGSTFLAAQNLSYKTFNAVAWSGNTVSWYPGLGRDDYASARSQCNEMNIKYCYIAVG